MSPFNPPNSLSPEALACTLKLLLDTIVSLAKESQKRADSEAEMSTVLRQRQIIESLKEQLELARKPQRRRTPAKKKAVKP